jgi:hypothetical protein
VILYEKHYIMVGLEHRPAERDDCFICGEIRRVKAMQERCLECQSSSDTLQ